MIARSSPLVRAALFGCAVAACSATSEKPDGPVATASSPIINGKDSPASEDAVVLLVGLVGQGAYTCTATLLAPNLLLTARHCVSQMVEGGFACDENGKLLPGSTGGTVGADNPLSSMYVFTGTTRPDFSAGAVTPAAQITKIFHDSAKVVCGHDIALLLLDKKIPGAKIAPIRLDSPAVAGETFTAVGWGVTTTTASPGTRQQRTGIKILRVGPVAASSTAGPLPPNEFEVGESICQGDSGGPALATATGAVIGTVSAGGNGQDSSTDPSAGCVGSDTFNDYTAVAPFQGLITDALKEAGQDPWLEGGPNPLLAKDGAACDADGDCQSGTCSNGTCVTLCDSAKPCTEPAVCTKSGDVQVCQFPNDEGDGGAPGYGGGRGSGCAIGGRSSGASSLFAVMIALGCIAARRRARIGRAR